MLLMCALGLLSLCTFWRVVHNDFVPFDDDMEILNNAHVQSGLTSANLRWMFSDTHQTERYTPLSWIAWSLICSMAGLNPAAFHVESLVVHVINTVLVFLVLREVFPYFLKKAGRDAREGCAAIVAALWSVHPLRVEVVAWVTQVRFAEATAFALLAFLFYCRARGPGGGSTRAKTLFYLLSVGSYAASILFYPTGIGLCVILFLLDVLIMGGKIRAAVARTLPFLIPAAFVAFMTVYGRFADQHSAHAATSLAQFDLSHRVMQAAYMFTCYLWKPFDVTHISPVYTVLVHFDPFSPLFALSLLSLIVITLAAIAFRKARPGFAFAWISHLALIAPVGGYFEFPYYPSDRYSYMDAILWTAVAGVLLFTVWERARPVIRSCIVAGAGVLVVSMAVLSAAQITTWCNGETLYRHILAELGDDPYAVDIHVRLARYYFEHGRLDDAIAEEANALKIWPAYPPAVQMREMLIGAMTRGSSGATSAPAGEGGAGR